MVLNVNKGCLSTSKARGSIFSVSRRTALIVVCVHQIFRSKAFPLTSFAFRINDEVSSFYIVWKISRVRYIMC